MPKKSDAFTHNKYRRSCKAARKKLPISLSLPEKILCMVFKLKNSISSFAEPILKKLLLKNSGLPSESISLIKYNDPMPDYQIVLFNLSKLLYNKRKLVHIAKQCSIL